MTEVGSFEVYKRFNRFHLPETFNGKTDIVDLIRFLREYSDYCNSHNLDYDADDVRHFVAAETANAAATRVETFGLEQRQQVINYVLHQLYCPFGANRRELIT